MPVSKFKPISTKALTPTQRASALKVLRFYRDRNKYNGVTSVRVNFEFLYAGTVTMEVRTRRSDCQPHSQRQFLCEQYCRLYLGARGAILVNNSRHGPFIEDAVHVSYMVGGKHRAGKGWVKTTFKHTQTATQTREF